MNAVALFRDAFFLNGRTSADLDGRVDVTTEEGGAGTRYFDYN